MRYRLVSHELIPYASTSIYPSIGTARLTPIRSRGFLCLPVKSRIADTAKAGIIAYFLRSFNYLSASLST
jgi:hypothetical protein